MVRPEDGFTCPSAAAAALFRWPGTLRMTLQNRVCPTPCCPPAAAGRLPSTENSSQVELRTPDQLMKQPPPPTGYCLPSTAPENCKKLQRPMHLRRSPGATQVLVESSDPVSPDPVSTVRHLVAVEPRHCKHRAPSVRSTPVHSFRCIQGKRASRRPRAGNCKWRAVGPSFSRLPTASRTNPRPPSKSAKKCNGPRPFQPGRRAPQMIITPRDRIPPGLVSTSAHFVALAFQQCKAREPSDSRRSCRIFRPSMRNRGIPWPRAGNRDPWPRGGAASGPRKPDGISGLAARFGTDSASLSFPPPAPGHVDVIARFHTIANKLTGRLRTVTHGDAPEFDVSRMLPTG
jgi:hypothetical protein